MPRSDDTVDIAAILERTRERAAKYGITLDPETSVDEEYSTVNAEELRQASRKSAQDFTNALEVVINQLHHEHASTVKKCVWCKQEFITTYCYHQFCSDQCRILEFRERFKIDPRELRTPPSEWTYEPVGVVPADMTANLYRWAKWLTTQFENLTYRDIQELPELELETEESLSVELPPLLSESQEEPESHSSADPTPDDVPQSTPALLPNSLEDLSFDF